MIVGILAVTFSMILTSNQKISIIEGGDFNDPNFWLIADHIALNNATIRDGSVFMWVNETRGGNCIFSGVQQGRLPHGWHKKDSIYELEVRGDIEASLNVLWINIIANRSSFTYYNETFSFVNVGVMLWLQLDENYDKPINESSQLEIDINIASFMYSNGEEKPITWDSHFKGEEPFPDRDYHYVDSSNNVMLEPNKTYEITIDVGQIIQKAFNTFNIQKAKLKSFDIYIEAQYGYGEASIEHVEFVFAPKIYSRYVIYQSVLNGLLSLSAAFLTLHLFKRIKNKPKPKHLGLSPT